MNKITISATIATIITAIVLVIFQEPNIVDTIFGVIDMIFVYLGYILPYIEYVIIYTAPIIQPIGAFMTQFAETILGVMPTDPMIYYIASVVIVVVGAIVNIAKPEKVEKLY